MRAVPLAFGLAGLWALLAGSGALEPLERLSATGFYRTRPVEGFHAPVTIVAIDERSLARFGQMPWNRRVFARLLDRLHAAGTAVVGIDVAFNEPARDPREDAALISAMRRIPTVLPTFLAFADAGRQTLRAVDPLPPFADAAVALGSIQLSSEQQAQVWQVEPYQDALGRRVPAFPIAVLGARQNHAWSPEPVAFPWRGGPAWIDFRGPANTAAQVSAVDLYDGRAPHALLSGCMALVGAVAPGLPDTNFSVPDPRGGPMSGVELSANVIDDAAAGGFFKRLSPVALALLLALFAGLLGIPLCRGVGGARRRGPLLAVALATWLLLAAWAFRHGVWLEVVPVVGLLASSYLAGLLVERTELLQARNQLLGRYATDLATEAQRQRARIEGELHDGIQQLLVVMGREVRQVQRLAPSDQVRDRLDRLGGLADDAYQEIKRLRGDLLPPALRHGGLREALPMLADETAARLGIDARVEAAEWEPLAPERESELYWLVKEALNNAEKYARASSIRIRLAQSGDDAVIEVVDDGVGFQPPDLSVAPSGLEHSGLHRMWLRMKGQRGDLQIRSTPGAGTSLRFSLPRDHERIRP